MCVLSKWKGYRVSFNIIVFIDEYFYVVRLEIQGFAGNAVFCRLLVSPITPKFSLGQKFESHKKLVHALGLGENKTIL